MRYDVIIIGSGAGGATLAYGLKDWGKKILVIERGDFLPRSKENWDPEAVFRRHVYKASEVWYDGRGRPFHPGIHYFVGGNTKVYGAALPRLRREDFEELPHREGVSPAWPIRYEDLEPYYARAEVIYRVHGVQGEDPTDPPRSSPFPFGPVPHEPYVAELAERLQKLGLHPFHLPMGIDLHPAGGGCIRCDTCDGYPCLVQAKADAHVSCLLPALASGNVTLMTRARAVRLVTDSSGREVRKVQVELGPGAAIHRAGSPTELVGPGREPATAGTPAVLGKPAGVGGPSACVEELSADLFVVAAGAVNSAALLLRSASDRHPHGLANSSGLVGRNYMCHNATIMMAIRTRRPNDVVFQKTLAFNDFYFRGPSQPYPLGNVQLIGKAKGPMIQARRPLVPGRVARALAAHSVDWWIMSEDLPDPENRVTLTRDGHIQLHWRPTNYTAHRELVRTVADLMQRAGFDLILTDPQGIATTSHQVGTARFGRDPKASVLDPFCRAHDVPNLFVVDGSFFPSSAAVNPALTIAAQALRVADHIIQTY